MALLAEGVRISSIARAKGVKADTVLDWLRAGTEHAEAVEEVLLADYKLGRVQIDGLWAYVGNKGEKGAPREPGARQVLALHADRDRHAAARRTWRGEDRDGGISARLGDVEAAGPSPRATAADL